MMIVAAEIAPLVAVARVRLRRPTERVRGCSGTEEGQEKGRVRIKNERITAEKKTNAPLKDMSKPVVFKAVTG
jgi:hypothetical protein